MLHNEDEYPDPFAFKPERFLKDGKLNPNIRDPALMAFGFGRRWQHEQSLFPRIWDWWSKQKYRLCPGYHIAFSTFWLTAATILATFNLSKAVDKDGRVIEPSGEYSTGMVRWVKPQSVKMQSDESWNSHPLPFDCSIKPRSPITEELIRSAVDSFWPTLPMRSRSLRNDFFRYSTARCTICLRISMQALFLLQESVRTKRVRKGSGPQPSKKTKINKSMD